MLQTKRRRRELMTGMHRQNSKEHLLCRLGRLASSGLVFSR